MIRMGVIRSVYFNVNARDVQNCRSSKARSKLSRPMKVGSASSDQLWNESQTIRTNG